jgi:hypothetical protein
MQDDGPGAAMLVVPTVKARATDFSIAAIMARGPRGERRTACGGIAAAAAAHHSVGLPTLGKFPAFRPFCVTAVRVKCKCHKIVRSASVFLGRYPFSRHKYLGLLHFGTWQLPYLQRATGKTPAQWRVMVKRSFKDLIKEPAKLVPLPLPKDGDTHTHTFWNVLYTPVFVETVGNVLRKFFNLSRSSD